MQVSVNLIRRDHVLDYHYMPGASEQPDRGTVTCYPVTASISALMGPDVVTLGVGLNYFWTALSVDSQRHESADQSYCLPLGLTMLYYKPGGGADQLHFIRCITTAIRISVIALWFSSDVDLSSRRYPWRFHVRVISSIRPTIFSFNYSLF